MTRPGFQLFAVAALASGFGLAALAQDATSEDSPTSESQPVEGAATAPVAPGGEEDGEGSKTMSGPKTTNPAAEGETTSSMESDGPSAEASTGTNESAFEEDCPEDGNTDPGCDNTAPTSDRQPVEGAATAPVAPEGADGEDTTTMEGPDDAAESEED